MQGQYQLSFEGRIDEAALRAAASDLVRLHPMAAARLVRDGTSKPRWTFPVADRIPLIVESVEGDAGARLERAAREFEVPIDPESTPPLRLVLLRGKGVGDLLLVHFSHVLMDGNAPPMMFESLFRWRAGEAGGTPMDANRIDEIEAWLASRPEGGKPVPMGTRRRGPSAAEAASVPSPDVLPRPYRAMVLQDAIDAAATEALRRRIRVMLGFENLTPALVASAFRAMARSGLVGERREGAVFRTSVPISLRPSLPFRAPVFCNLTAHLHLEAGWEELEDRDALVRSLGSRMRAQIRSGADVESARRTHWLAQRSDSIIEALMRRHWGGHVTLKFGFFGRTPEAMRRMFGSRLVGVHTVNAPSRTPQISIHELDGLHVSLSYAKGALEEGAGRALLRGFLDDLVEE